jgi:hypothetical protein
MHPFFARGPHASFFTVPRISSQYCTHIVFHTTTLATHISVDISYCDLTSRCGRLLVKAKCVATVSVLNTKENDPLCNPERCVGIVTRSGRYT